MGGRGQLAFQSATRKGEEKCRHICLLRAYIVSAFLCVTRGGGEARASRNMQVEGHKVCGLCPFSWKEWHVPRINCAYLLSPLLLTLCWFTGTGSCWDLLAPCGGFKSYSRKISCSVHMRGGESFVAMSNNRPTVASMEQLWSDSQQVTGAISTYNGFNNLFTTRHLSLHSLTKCKGEFHFIIWKWKAYLPPPRTLLFSPLGLFVYSSDFHKTWKETQSTLFSRGSGKGGGSGMFFLPLSLTLRDTRDIFIDFPGNKTQISMEKTGIFRGVPSMSVCNFWCSLIGFRRLLAFHFLLEYNYKLKNLCLSFKFLDNCSSNQICVLLRTEGGAVLTESFFCDA